MKRLLAALLLTLSSSWACAQDNDEEFDVVRYYVCEAQQVLELADDGRLQDTDFAKALMMYQSRFAIDRKTGLTMAGPFASFDARDISVLSEGDEQDPFAMIALANAPYVHLKALQIKAYAAGPRKPFLGTTGNLVITGTCEPGESSGEN